MLTFSSNTSSLSTTIAETTPEDAHNLKDAVPHGRRSDLAGTVATIAVRAQGRGHGQKTDKIVSQRQSPEV